MEKKFISEGDAEQEKWYEQARAQTLETLPSFLTSLLDPYSHDEVTLVHAMTAGCMGLISAMNAHPEGGLNPAQTQLLLGMFIRKWARIEGPAKIMSWAGLLDPRNEAQVMGIPKEVATWLTQCAQTALNDIIYKGQEQKDHLEKIAKGEMPWGLKILQ